MYSVGVLGVLGVLVAWLLVLTFFYWKEKKVLDRLVPSTKDGDIKDKFKELLNAFDEIQRRDQILNRNIRDVYKEGLKHIQKIALLRYNPYQDTGGNMSFSIALLNGKDSGFVLTSLHTRAGTRIYTKAVIDGKSELQLSKEEREVLKQALTGEKDGEDK